MRMRLDEETCWEALRARDRGWDGRFVAGVRTTGIYCRPGCAARLPLRRNVRFFPGPDEAERSGFRPCRRCHPQDSARGPLPGTRKTVDRALRLLSSGEAGTSGAELDRLAARCGVTARHLRRLFAVHLGATPAAVLRRMKVDRARRLLETTALGVADVAEAAGFASVRRFNEVFREAIGMTPRSWRAESNRRAGPGACAPATRAAESRTDWSTRRPS